MKVPYAPKVEISHTGAEYQKPADYSGGANALIAGLRAAQGAAQQIENEDKYETDKSARFKALVDFTHFEQGTADAVEEVKRNWTPETKDFDGQVNKVIDSQKSKFLKGIDPNLHDEFDYRAEQVRLGLHNETAQFKTTQSDAFEKAGLQSIITKAQEGVAADASTASTWIGRVHEAIDQRHLSGAAKTALKLQTEAKIRGIDYGDAYWKAQTGQLPSDLTPQEQFLLNHHEKELARGGVKNADGSISTVKQITVERDGRTYSIPTIWDGKEVDTKTAIKKAEERGWSNWPSYASEKEAQARYDQIHTVMDRGAAPTTITTAEGYLGRLRQVENAGGGSATKNPNSSAQGIYQFTAGTWADLRRKHPELGLTADGRTDNAQQERAIQVLTGENQAYLTKALGRPPSPGELYLAHQQGAAGAAALLANPNELAATVVGEDAVRLNGGGPGMTAGQFAEKWIGKFEGGGGTSPALEAIDNDPRFALVSYEDRIAIRQDVDRQIKLETAEQVAADKLSHDTAYNTFLQSLIDQPDKRVQLLDQATQEGLLANFDERKKAMDLVKSLNAETDDWSEGLSRMSQGLQPSEKQLNAVIGHDDGVKKLQSRDQGYVENSFIPTVVKAGAWPSDAQFALKNMALGQDLQARQFALNVMAQLEDQLPETVYNNLGKDAISAVEAWRNQKYLTPEQLASMQQGGLKAEDRAHHEALTEEAKKATTRGDDPVDLSAGWIAKHFQEPGNLPFGLSDTSPSPPMYPGTAIALEKEAQALFIENYPLYRDEEKTKDAVVKLLQIDWGWSTVNGRLSMMKNPPERSGYAVGPEGDMSWISREVQTHYGQVEGEAWEPLSDDQTQRERAALGQPGAPLPSYRIITFDKFGTPNLKPGRKRFEKSALDLSRESTRFNFDVAKANYYQFMATTYVPAADVAFSSNVMKVPEEIETQKKEFEKKLREAEDLMRKDNLQINPLTIPEPQDLPGPIEQPATVY